MPMLHALRSWSEFHDDTTVHDFLTRYFAYVAPQPASVFTDGWGNTRWGDTIDVIYWLYNRTGNSDLLDLVTKIHANMAELDQQHRQPAQRQLRPGLPRIDPVLAALRRQGRPRRRLPELHHHAGHLRPVPGRRVRGRRERPARLQRPAPGFRDLRHRRVHGQPRDPDQDHRRPALGRPHRGAWRSTCCPPRSTRRARSATTSPPRTACSSTTWSSPQLQFDNGFAMQAYLPGVDQYRCCPHNYGQGWPLLRRGDVAGHRWKVAWRRRCSARRR